MRRCALLSLSLCVLTFASPAGAEIISAWDTNGATGSETSLAPNTSALNVSGVSLVRGAGLSASAAANSFSSSGWTQQATDFMEFGFDVAKGFQVNLEALKIATRSSGTGPGTLGLFTSLDGFVKAVFTFNQPGTNFLNSDIDLSGLGPITDDFRVRITQIGTNSAGGGATASGGTFRVGDFFDGASFQDIQFEGTVQAAPVAQVVPEPATWCLALFIGGCAWRGVKRRKMENA